MRTSKLGALGLTIAATTVHAAGKTSIYIDQIPGYSALAPCAENRVSAIVRAQASGCGDDQALTSFSCFCIDQYTHISSIISTAVQDYCSAQATTLPATLTAALPEVTSAIEVFNDYCARSTELAWYQQNSTSSLTPSITPAPSSPTAPISPSSSTSSGATSPSPSKSSVPVAAIAAPVVIGVLAIAGIVGLLFFLRRRRSGAKAAAAAAEEKEANPYLPPDYAPGYAPMTRELRNGGVHEVETPVQEVVGDTVKYRYELETRPAELEGAGAGRK